MDMIKLLIISLEEPEQEIYDKIIEIVNEAHISVDETIEGKRERIKNGELLILPDQHKVLKENREVNLTNIEFRILYVLALHQGITLSKKRFTIMSGTVNIFRMTAILLPMSAVSERKLKTIPASQNISRRYVGLDIK